MNPFEGRYITYDKSIQVPAGDAHPTPLEAYVSASDLIKQFKNSFICHSIQITETPISSVLLKPERIEDPRLCYNLQR